MKKRDFIKGMIGLSIVSPLFPLKAKVKKMPQASGKKMNLLMITADDLDFSLPGFMGGRAGLTPNLDGLAQRSHIFRNNRTVAAICMPSREAFMSGLVPHKSGGTGFIPMKEGTKTITSQLKEYGWYTAATHKIDHMLPASSFPWDFSVNGKDRNVNVHAVGLKLAIEEAKSQYKPFFVNCNINDPHRPFYGSQKGLAMDHDNTGSYKIADEIKPEEVIIPPFLEDLPEIRTELAQYWNSAQRMDIAIGEILSVLQRSGEAQNTIILFCSDHGMPFPFSKATCYEHGTRVPVLLSWPGMGKATEFSQVTESVDILPTLLELLDVPHPENIDGKSWLPIINENASREFAVTYINEISSGYAYPVRAIQDSRYSLIFSPWVDGKLKFKTESMSGLTFNALSKAAESSKEIQERVAQYIYGIPYAFYDLQRDPGQRHNLIHEPEHQQRIKRMQEMLLAKMKKTNDPQLTNFRLFLSGKKTVVKQDPDKYRLKGFKPA